MRPIEALLVFLLVCSLASLLMPARARPVWMRWLPVAALVCAALQLGIEGYRWQLVFVYIVASILGVAAAVGALRGRPAATVWWRHALVVVGAISCSLALAFGGFLAVGVPMFELPEPSGPHRVGVTRLHVEDPARPETL